MKIIVTGGAGFIGSHVADAYHKAGHRVAVIDNLSSGKRINIPRGVKLHKADIRDAGAMNRIFKLEKPDVLNHHAAFISVTESVKEPQKTFAINVTGTLNVIMALAQSGAQKKKMLFSSTGGAIYGNPTKLPADEKAQAVPLSPYALSKYVDEQMIEYYCGAYGITYLIFRYANVYGPRQREQGGAGIFPIFAHLMREGKTPTIFGDGTKTRDYVFVEDVARASVLGLKRGANTIVNIASARETSDDAVYAAIAKTLDFTKHPRYTPKRPGEVERIYMSYQKAKKILGWAPRHTLAEGVLKTVRTLG
jgi:UDP-glucose 4-epimerase